MGIMGWGGDQSEAHMGIMGWGWGGDQSEAHMGWGWGVETRVRLAWG